MHSSPQSSVANELHIVGTDQYRGSIYSGEILLFKGFPDPTEYTDETFTLHEDISAWRVFECLEGTLMRVFHYDGCWYTSTSHKLDAFKSKWASRETTFGKSFSQELRLLDPVLSNAVEDDNLFLSQFYEKYLGKEKLYAFLLKPTHEERIVCDYAAENRVVYIGCEQRDTHFVDFDDEISLEDGTNVYKRVELVGLKSSKEIVDYVYNNVDYRTSQGLILFNQDHGNMIAAKVLLKEYETRFLVRGNVSSRRFRYLELRPDSGKCDEFLALYPDMKQQCEELETEIYSVCKHLHNLYMKIYINHEKVSKLSQEEDNALKRIHKQYLNTRQPTIPGRINDILTNGDATRLNRLLREQTLRNKFQ